MPYYNELSDQQLDALITEKTGKSAPHSTDLNYAWTLPLPKTHGFIIVQVPSIAAIRPFVIVQVAQLGVAEPILQESGHELSKVARAVCLAWLRFQDELAAK